MEIGKNAIDIQNKVYDYLCEMTAEQVLRLITCYHGMQLLDDDFFEFLHDEGVIKLVDDDDEDEEEEDE